MVNNGLAAQAGAAPRRPRTFHARKIGGPERRRGPTAGGLRSGLGRTGVVKRGLASFATHLGPWVIVQACGSSCFRVGNFVWGDRAVRLVPGQLGFLLGNRSFSSC